MIANTHYGYVGKSKAPKFTYTGNYKVRDDGVVELLTSGTIVFLEPKVIDVFMVGGGGAGATNFYGQFDGGGGGGGGYTRTIRKFAVSANANYQVTVGAGQVSKTTGSGGASAFGSYEVSGGLGGGSGSNDYLTRGWAGGSGGGGFANGVSSGGTGGSDGNPGERTSIEERYVGGEGQGFTTREFGESTGKLYAGGGGGGRYISASTPVVSMGGSGGGGTGAWWGGNSDKFQEATAGGANTGGGGGGGINKNGMGTSAGGDGGSGIVCFRKSVELPELAGTWVLNERLYAPESNFEELVAYTAGQSISTIVNNMDKISTMPSDIGSGNLTLYMRQSGSSSTRGTSVYNFVKNKWVNTTKYKYITFPIGATASNEFRAWLASNATKQ